MIAYCKPLVLAATLLLLSVVVDSMNPVPTAGYFRLGGDNPFHAFTMARDQFSPKLIKFWVQHGVRVFVNGEDVSVVIDGDHRPSSVAIITLNDDHRPGFASLNAARIELVTIETRSETLYSLTAGPDDDSPVSVEFEGDGEVSIHEATLVD